MTETVISEENRLFIGKIKVCTSTYRVWR